MIEKIYYNNLFGYTNNSVHVDIDIIKELYCLPSNIEGKLLDENDYPTYINIKTGYKHQIDLYIKLINNDTGLTYNLIIDNFIPNFKLEYNGTRGVSDLIINIFIDINYDIYRDINYYGKKSINDIYKLIKYKINKIKNEEMLPISFIN